jgi:DUF971 family protein
MTFVRVRYTRREMSSTASGSTVDPPTDIIVHQLSRRLEIAFGEHERYSLDFEFLRVHSPSASVQGHGPGQEVLQVGKREVTISAVEPVGHYAIRPTFSDGHDSGIFTWTYLRDLGRNRDAMWAEYLRRLDAAKQSRDAPRASSGTVDAKPIVFHANEARRK